MAITPTSAIEIANKFHYVEEAVYGAVPCIAGFTPSYCRPMSRKHRLRKEKQRKRQEK